MRGRIELMFSGVVGLTLTALFYFVALQLQGVMKFVLLLPQGGSIIFWILLSISLVETVVMTLALRTLAAQMPGLFLNLVAGAYVAFAGVYCLLYALLVPDPRGIEILAADSILRWFTLFLVKPSAHPVV